MKFLWTAINVKDLDESIDFYSSLIGLTMQKRFPAGPDMEIAFMGNGTENETLVELIADKKNTAVNFTGDISIGFAVKSVDTMLETIKNKGISVYKGPIETPRSRFFYVKDPNGVVVQFFQVNQ